MSEPVARVHDIAFPRFSAPDLDEMQQFLEAFGMRVAHRDVDHLYMRGTDGAHHVHATTRGEAGFAGLAFRAGRAELDALADASGTVVEANDEPAGGMIVRLADPDGRRVDVICDDQPVAAIDVAGHAPVNTGSDRVRVDDLQRVPTGASQVKRFGHAAIKTTSISALTDWYSSMLGLLISDELDLGEPDTTVGRFMRCDRGGLPTDHHTLLLLETGEVKLGHCAWEVADFDDLMAGHHHLLADGRRHYWGVGRHVLGGQVFDYWKDPLGFTLEHWTDSDLLTAAVPAGRRTLFEPLNQWGPNPPADLDF